MNENVSQKAIIILTLITVFFIGCHQDTGIIMNDRISNDLTEDEAHLIECYLLGNNLTETEITNEAQFIIDLLDGSLSTRSENRKIANIEVLTSKIQTRMGKENFNSLLYVINFTNEAGYTILSGDRRTDRVWAIIPKGSFHGESEDNNTKFEIVIDFISDACACQIKCYKEIEELLLDDVLAKIQEKTIKTRIPIQNLITTYGDWETEEQLLPLVKVKWGQNSPYNDSVPSINGIQPPAGCTATAIAHLMSYYSYPDIYNWDEINKEERPISSIAKKEVARMFRTIGDNVHMQWNLSGSGAYLSDGRFHFKKMGYKYPGECFMDNYDRKRIVNSLLDKIPVGISGYDTRTTDTTSTGNIIYIYENGHSWVIDGFLQRKRIVKVYDVVNDWTISHIERGWLLHCNFGWSGSSDGYYNSEAFNTNDGPVATRAYNYRYGFDVLYNVKAYDF